MKTSTVVWRRNDLPGHESCRLRTRDTGFEIAGVAVLAYERQACRLDYVINCDSHWQTQSAMVTGWVGDRTIEITVARDADGQWRLNGRYVEDVAGCMDIDLNFSPATNLLPIRRLNLSGGATASARAAWLRFPSFTLEVLEQVYTRLASGRYRYESADGRFVAEPMVDEAGQVIAYGDIWSRDTGV